MGNGDEMNPWQANWPKDANTLTIEYSGRKVVMLIPESVTNLSEFMDYVGMGVRSLNVFPNPFLESLYELPAELRDKIFKQ